MKTVSEAIKTVLEHTRPCGAEEVSIFDSAGRVLLEDVYSNRDHPPYDVSAMDGYAVRSEDIRGASRENPAVLSMVEDIKAGSMPRRVVENGQAARIMTGAPVPQGADTVVRVEDTDTDGRVVKIFTPSACGTDIRRKGENLREGEPVLHTGTDLKPAEVGILAMVKKKTVRVGRRPSVAVLSTGDELEGLEDRFDPLKIPDANSYTLMAQLSLAGAVPELVGIARDRKEELREKLSQALACDAVVVSGGVSVGHHDFVRETIKELGVDMKFWRVAIRPGHPFAFGISREGIPLFALPGNPVSSMVCFEVFVVPAIRKMLGAKRLFRKAIRVTVGGTVKDKRGRTNFVRVRIENTPTETVARLTGRQGSGILMNVVGADGLLIVPQECDELKEGDNALCQFLCVQSFQERPPVNEV